MPATAGHRSVRAPLAERLARFTGAPVDPDRQLGITPSIQAGLFLALSRSSNPATT